jgi:hypothetical protein
MLEVKVDSRWNWQSLCRQVPLPLAMLLGAVWAACAVAGTGAGENITCSK